MILLVDAGNTRIKWAYAGPRGGPAVESDYAGSAYYGKPRERAASLETMLASTWSAHPTPARALVSNVGGDEVKRGLESWLQQQWQICPEFVCSQASGWGVVNAYEHPARLGVDRWVSLVAGYNLIEDACCIIDSGTAVTVDGITGRGRHIGGVIMPGLSLMRRSLLEQTSEIRCADGSGEPGLGVDTGGAVATGTAFALVAGVERALAEVEGALGSPPATLVTGGDAGFIRASLSRDSRIEHDLVLKGLAIMANSDR